MYILKTGRVLAPHETINDALAAAARQGGNVEILEARPFGTLTLGRGNGRGAARAAGGGSITRDMACRAPGCGERSKGPRYGYLCEKHVSAPAKDRKAWSKAWAAKKAGKPAASPAKVLPSK